MESKKLLLIGGGGHCHVIIDSLLSLGRYDQIGIVDYKGIEFCGIHVVGTDDDLPLLREAGWNEAFITVGSVGKTDVRRHLWEMIQKYMFSIPSIIDPTAVLARDITVERGVYIGKRATINAGAIIREGAIINTGSIVEHDCEVGAFSHVSPGAILCGQVKIGHDTHIGAGSVIRQMIHVGNETIIGAGSVVVNDIMDHSKAYGNPCRVIESI